MADPKTYATVVSLGILCYDYFLTLPQEVNLIWSRRFTLGTLLFFVCRYLPFVDIPISLHVYTSTKLTAAGCHSLVIVCNSIQVVGIGTAEVILLLRTIAIWERNPYVIFGIVLLFLTSFGASCVFTTLYLLTIQFSKSHARACNAYNVHWIVLLDYVVILVIETVVILLTLVKAIQHLRASTSSWLYHLYQRGLVYFIFIFITSLSNIIIPVFAEDTNKLALTDFQRVLHSVLCSRVILLILQQKSEYDSRELRASHRADTPILGRFVQTALDLDSFMIPDEQYQQYHTETLRIV
ncbi:hypothetical protein CPB83DRAFT_199001 [Crepidotus variabilis]|uniref:DUF6533 domain-containing protein n=1 Tax=Crepidotus variabilis TaxID=179855 RepID=A0A9P6EJG8_9AGAR|nr:hypothetical protein CPB83DRAFT_199001 [Crepidotus variabilis]